MNIPEFLYFSSDYFFRVILPVIITLVVGITTEHFLESKISSFGKKKDLLPSQIHLMKLVTRWTAILIIILIVAGIFGIALGNLWVSISAIIAMIVVGFFAGWSLLANILAAIFVIIWKPVEIGDRITILPEEISGELTDLNLFYGELTTDEGDLVKIPNVNFINKFIKVHSKRRTKKKSK